MSDGSIIYGNNRKEIYIQMKEYFKLNGKSKENRPKLILPVQILTLDKNKKVQKVIEDISPLDFYKKITLYYLKNYKLITLNRVTNIKFFIKSMNNFMKIIC